MLPGTKWSLNLGWSLLTRITVHYKNGNDYLRISLYFPFGKKSQKTPSWWSERPFTGLPTSFIIFSRGPRRFCLLLWNYLCPKTQDIGNSLGNQTRSLRNEPQPTVPLGHYECQHHPLFLNACSLVSVSESFFGPCNMWGGGGDGMCVCVYFPSTL